MVKTQTSKKLTPGDEYATVNEELPHSQVNITHVTQSDLVPHQHKAIRTNQPTPQEVVEGDTILMSQGFEREFTEAPYVASNKGIQAKIVVIIPTYNEERFIGSIVIMARQYADIVIVVDDGSTDKTAKIAQSAGAVLVAHDRNMGKGMALNTGFTKALEFEPTVVVTLDGDGQHLPSEMPLVIAPILKDEADIVVGSRYIENLSNVPKHRVIGHRLFNSITNILSGVAITDTQSGFRAFSARSVAAISFSSSGFSVESEIQFIANEKHLRMVEVPIIIQYKDKPKRSVIMQGVMVLNGILKMVGQYRPLLFFGVPGALMLIGGILWGVWVVDIYRRTEQLAVGYTLISLLLSMLGMMLLTTSLSLHSIRGLLIDMLRTRHEDK